MCRPTFVVGCMAFALLGHVIGALPASAAPSLFSKSHALIIGIGRYDSNAWPSLDYAKKDARAMASFLKDQGYEVRTLLDSQATRVRILRELSDYLENRLEPNDRFVFFFSGHGETKERSGRDFGYIVPHDGGDDVGNWISMAELRDISRQLDKARHQLFLLDSCYGGEFAVKGMLSSISERDHPNYVEAISRNKARQFITAGGKGERVRADGPDGYSYFTGYLLKALKGAADANGDGYVTASELHGYLEPAASNWDHTPLAGVLPGHEQGNFWFRVGDESLGERISSAVTGLGRKIPLPWKGSGDQKDRPDRLPVTPARSQTRAAYDDSDRPHACRTPEELVGICGIEEKTQEKLHALGFCTLADIEGMAPEDMALIQAELPWTRGSIDGGVNGYVPWAEQAAAIRRGQPPC